jgi:DNA-binding IclR family transcriptional regulator
VRILVVASLSDPPILVKVAPAVSTNQSIARAVALLQAIADRPGEASIAALARATGLTRPTASRLLATLEQHGLVDRATRSDRYVLGYGLVRLGRIADPFAGVADRAAPVLEALADETGESATLALVGPDGSIDFVAQADGPSLIGGRRWVGQRFALHASSSGKLLLAGLSGADRAHRLPDPLPALTPRTITDPVALDVELATVAAQGFAVTLDELEVGLAGVSVGLHHRGGALLAIVSVSGPTFRYGEQERAAALRALQGAIAALDQVFAPA